MANMGFRGFPPLTFGYVEGTSTSTAFGLDDNDSGKFKIQSLNTIGAQPTGTVQITVDPSTNGNITLNPNGTGAVVVTTDLNMPNTASASVGVINFGGTRFIHNASSSNDSVYVGGSAGQITSTGRFNVGVGLFTLGSLTTGVANTSIGVSSSFLLTTGSNNCAMGNSLTNLRTGSFNIAIGQGSGANYTSSESNNICISNNGANGESNTIRIGGGAGGAHTSCFIKGIQGVNATSGNALYVNSSDQLGDSTTGTTIVTLGSTSSTSATTVQSGSGALNVTSTNGALTINSGTGTLGIATDASANTVNIATGGAVKTTTLGSTNSTSATTVQSGSGACNFGTTGTGNTNIGNTTGTTSIQFGTGSALTSYIQDGTWTPTIVGATTAGTTTYTTQTGSYIKIGKLVWISGFLNISAATGTGDATLSNFPFTAKSDLAAPGVVTVNAAGWTWPAGRTSTALNVINGTTTGNISCSGSATGATALQMTNAAAIFRFSAVYQTTA